MQNLNLFINSFLERFQCLVLLEKNIIRELLLSTKKIRKVQTCQKSIHFIFKVTIFIFFNTNLNKPKNKQILDERHIPPGYANVINT